jgi:crotonobetainyl-CoA:carnitine CoA-transferase CaiB-like acyl-CoA transferase
MPPHDAAASTVGDSPSTANEAEPQADRRMPLDGIRVLEVAMYGFVPSAGAVLAEWGADVVKVEHAVTGDPQRGLRQTGLLRVEGDPNPNIEHANRLKRSVGLDMSVPEGKEVLYELARRSDVFLTSFLPGHRKKFGIDVDDIRAVNPKIIYARGSALGPRGAESEKGGYDMTAFWCRAASAPENRRSSTSHCWAADSGRWVTPWR